jgi:xylulokinase
MPEAGRFEHDPRAWLAGAFESGREAVQEAGTADVEVIGIGALGPAPVLVDERLEPLTPAPLYGLDRRAEDERAFLGVPADHALPKLLWWQAHEPALFGLAAWALDAAGLVAAALTGDPTMDAITRLAYEHPEVEPGVSLPRPVEPLAEAGRLHREAAGALGLPTGIPVIAGTLDTYVDVASLGVGPGDGCLLLGSTLAVYGVVAGGEPVAGLELTPYPGEGLVSGGTTAAAGSVLGWLVNLLELAEEDERAAAELEPGSGGLVALPHLAGERAPFADPEARGALAGLSLLSGRIEIYRAFVDSLALAALAIADLLPAPETWRASGGGCRNTAWLGATCDALGAPIEVVEYAGEAVGPAHLALRSVGLEPPVRVGSRVEPDRERTRRFRDLAARQRRLYRRLRAVETDLSR